jgi:hypothetical protein
MTAHRFSDIFDEYHCLDATAWKKERPKEYESVREAHSDHLPFHRNFLTQKTN